jgi:glycosyltransferase involved in cell wall biosynthesis
MTIPLISVVIPVYKSAESLSELAARLISSVSTITEEFEILLVNDGSPDGSWDIITTIAKSDERFIGIDLSRNFGQHPAITAGLAHSTGKWIVVMDCDLQDQPEEIPRLFYKAQEGFQQVVAVRTNRQDNPMKRFFSWFFLRLLSQLSGQSINHRVGNFGIYHRMVVDTIIKMPEHSRTFTLHANWVGFRRFELEVQHASRKYGKTSYSFRKLVSLGLSSAIHHSDKPLRIAIMSGFFISLVSLMYALFIVVRSLFWNISVVGWTSLIVTLTLSTGIIVSTIGVVGLYVGKIFEESKGRPIYIVQKIINKDLG